LAFHLNHHFSLPSLRFHFSSGVLTSSFLAEGTTTAPLLSLPLLLSEHHYGVYALKYWNHLHSFTSKGDISTISCVRVCFFLLGMLLRSSPWHSPLWRETLAACHGQIQQHTASPTSPLPHGDGGPSPLWVVTWLKYFHGLQQNPSGPLQHSFDLVPTPLLKSMRQQWIDQTLHRVVLSRLAEVYPPARISLDSASSAVNIPDESVESSFEELLALWSAHFLLALLQKKTPLHGADCTPAHHDATLSFKKVDAVLAEGLHAEVLPVVSYLVHYSRFRSDNVCLSMLHVLQRALVLVLHSFWFAWQGTGKHGVIQHDVAPSPSESLWLSSAEAALAQELCLCLHLIKRAVNETGHGREVSSASIAAGAASVPFTNSHPSHRTDNSPASSDVAAGRSTGEVDDGTTPWESVWALRRETDALSKELCNAILPLHHAKNEGGRAAEGMLLKACQACVNTLADQASMPPRSLLDNADIGTRPQRTSAPSLFVGITGVEAPEDTPDDVVARINTALNQVALSTTSPV
jgi:hypothetical protein